MELKPLSDLRDQKTLIAQVMLPGKVLSGYLVFVLNGQLVQRRIYDMAYRAEFMSAMYITYKGTNYAVDLACRPMSGLITADRLTNWH